MVADWTARSASASFCSTNGREGSRKCIWLIFLVLVPVAGTVKLPSVGCVTYKYRDVCGLKGSSVELPCSYPNNGQVISISGWSKKGHPNMKTKQLKLINYPGRGNNDCTIKLKDLKKTDASIYYFVYQFRNSKGDIVTCKGVPGVRLYIIASPVSILVEELVRGQDVPVTDRTVMEGQRVTLTCVPTCAANLNSNPGYIWYKNRRQLNGSGANSPFLSLDPVSDEDTGSYVCAMIGYKHLPSAAVNLTVQRRPINAIASEIPDAGSMTDRVPPQVCSYDAHNCKDKIFNSSQTPKGKSMFTLSIMIVSSVCIGFVIATMVAVLLLKVKKKRKRRSTGSVPGSPNPNKESYMALDTKFLSSDYETLGRCSPADPIYENLSPFSTESPGTFSSWNH